VTRSRIVELYLYSSIRLHGAVLNLLSPSIILLLLYVVSECFEKVDEVPANITIKRVAFLHTILDASSQNFGPMTGHSDRLFVILFSLSRQMLKHFFKLGHNRFLQNPPHLFVHHWSYT
jgi:hypothetical protein